MNSLGTHEPRGAGVARASRRGAGRGSNPGGSRIGRSVRRSAFTLIELLVSTSIITILISVLLPALGRAREASRQIVCRNNLRTIWTGVLQYALAHRDRVPFLEDINLNDPDADPFDPEHRSTVGVALKDYLTEGVWRCPSAIKGYPQSAGSQGWTMTYWFRTAGKVGEGVPFDRTPWGTGSALDPIVSNYVNFDGRPLKFISGRRHTPSNPAAPNRDEIGPWTFSFPIIADQIEGDEAQGTPKYPHVGVVEKRVDLKAARGQFEKNSGTGRLPARMEIHAQGDKESVILLTRSPYKHRKGF